MEFVINTDLNTALPAAIDFNFEALKSELATNLKKYNGLVVTEDSIKDAKGDKAKLNKLRTAIEDKRKDVKKQCLAPYEEFEGKVKQIISMIDEPIAAIDKQVKAFDEAKKDEKRKTLEDFYKANAGAILDLLPFEKIFNSRWLNATYILTQATQEIFDQIDKVKNDVGIIKAMKLECEAQVLDVYLNTLDMSAALAEKSRFEEQQKRLAEYAAKQQEKAQEQPVEAVNAPLPKEQDKPAEPEYTASADAKTIKVIFYDTTPEFRADMKVLTKKHNIKYGGIQ